MARILSSAGAPCGIDAATWEKLGKEQRQFFALWEQWAPEDLPLPVPERRFARKSLRRSWLADIAWPECKTLLEFEGGIWSRQGGRKCPVCGQADAGAHGRAAGILRDICKYNAANVLNWIVFRVPVPEFKKSPGIILDMAVDLVQARWKQAQAWRDLYAILDDLMLAENGVPDEAIRDVVIARSLMEELNLRPYSTDPMWKQEDWVPKPKRRSRKRKR